MLTALLNNYYEVWRRSKKKLIYYRPVLDFVLYYYKSYGYSRPIIEFSV